MRGVASKAVGVGKEGKEVMSCIRMENKILGYLDGRLKEGERLDVEKHLGTCAACQVRVNEFRAVNVLLDELPMIEPSAAFDARVRARVAAEPAKQNWSAWFAPPPRVAIAASMLLLAMVWLGSRPADPSLNASEVEKINQNLPVLENFDVLSNFAPLTDLPQPLQADEGSDTNQNQKQM
jgi:negative regulator of sigma E activity